MPEEVKQPKVVKTPWWGQPWAPLPAVAKRGLEARARSQGFSIQRPSGEMAFTAPSTKTTPGLQAGTWEELTFIDRRYKDVLEAMAGTGDPDLYNIALKSKTKQPLSPDEIQLVNEVWMLMMEAQARQQEEIQTEEWYQAPRSSKMKGWGGGPEKQAFDVSQFGREEQRIKTRDVEDRYTMGRQAAEGRYNAQREQERLQGFQKIQEDYQARIEEQQKALIEKEKKRKALKGPQDWMKYMVELGETPSWLGYWFSKKGAQ